MMWQSYSVGLTLYFMLASAWVILSVRYPPDSDTAPEEVGMPTWFMMHDVRY